MFRDEDITPLQPHMRTRRGIARSFQNVGNNGGSLYRLRLTSDRLHIHLYGDTRGT